MLIWQLAAYGDEFVGQDQCESHLSMHFPTRREAIQYVRDCADEGHKYSLNLITVGSGKAAICSMIDHIGFVQRSVSKGSFADGKWTWKDRP
jgi:hypothetical protein